MEEEGGGEFMEEGLLTAVAVLMTDGHSEHAAAGCCCEPRPGPGEPEGEQEPT